MTKFECNKGETNVYFTGDTNELCADILTLVHCAYESLLKQNKTDAEKFKKYITMSFTDGLPFKSLDEINDVLSEEALRVLLSLLTGKGCDKHDEDK